MLKRIARGVVVFLCLMAWSVAPAMAGEEKVKTIGLMEELYVFPDKGKEFEALFKEVQGVFTSHEFPYRVDIYKLDDLRYLAMWWIEGTAGVDKLNSAWAVTAEKWGEDESAEWNKKLYATMSHWKASLWIPRPDISYRPENAVGEYKYIVWGQLTIKLGHQHEVEKLLKKYVEVFAEHEVPHAWSAAEGSVGTEVPTLSFVEWSSTASSYWLRQEENVKNKELNDKTEALWAKMTPHIRGFDYVAGWYLKELSYNPKTKVETN